MIHIFPIKRLATRPDLEEIHLSLNLEYLKDIFVASEYEYTSSTFLAPKVP
jgi:hypothetical protein